MHRRLSTSKDELCFSGAVAIPVLVAHVPGRMLHGLPQSLLKTDQPGGNVAATAHGVADPGP
jgi:hypothetical protein